MEPQQINPTNPIEPTPPALSGAGRFRPWLITILVALAAAVLAGGGVYYVMSKRLAAERAVLEHRITDLQNQIAQLKEEKFSNIIQPESIPQGNLVVAPFSSDGWLIYENLKYGVTFKYPKGWYKNSESEASAFFTKLKQLPSGDTEIWAYGDQISFTVEDRVLPINEWIVKNTHSGIDGYDKKIEREWITLNNIKVLRIKESALGTSDDIITNYIFKDDKVVILYLYPYLSNDLTIDQILSTFKFLDTAPVSTAGWNTFDQKGVRADVLPNFKFPRSWHTFNVAGGPFVEIHFSDGGNLIDQNLGNKTIESRLYELSKPQENECRLSVTASAETNRYGITEHNSKINDNSRRACNMILSTLRQQIQNQKTAK